MKILPGKSLFATALLAAMCLESAAQKYPLWGNLEAGKFDVGFRILNSYDLSRPPIPNQGILGQIRSAPSAAEGRQIQISIWYPSQKASTKRMDYEDYFFELAKELDFTPMTPENQNAAIDEYVTLIHESGNAKFGRAELQKFSSLGTAAIRNADAADGKFPVLFYPTYKSPVNQSILCEYLASHGYVVVSTSMKGASTNLPEISVMGIEAQVADLSFALGEVKKLPFVDRDRLGVMAIGFNATVCLAWLTRNPLIDAFISLDGGILVVNEKRMLQLTPFYDPSSITKPMLLIHTSHPDVSPATIDDYKYADRYFLHFPGMREFDFSDYGMLENISHGIIGATKSDTKIGFEWAGRYVLNFLNFTLLSDVKARNFISNTPVRNEVTAGVIESSVKLAMPRPPTLHELKVLIAGEGAAGLEEKYNSLKDADPQPFTQKVLTDLFNWLGYLRDTDGSIRLQLTKIWHESYPSSAKGHYLSARLLALKGDRSQAASHYKEALRLLELDPDPFLDNNTRIRIRTVAGDELKKM